MSEYAPAIRPSETQTDIWIYHNLDTNELYLVSMCCDEPIRYGTDKSCANLYCTKCSQLVYETDTRVRFVTVYDVPKHLEEYSAGEISRGIQSWIEWFTGVRAEVTIVE